jgi:DNA-binding TFAR19-related protein (PDSD5 family)
MEEFPDDYRHFWAAGARYYFDLKPADEEERRRLREKGAALIEEAMYKPNAPPDLATTAAAMRSKLGQHERALDALRQMILVTDNAKARDKMLDRVRESNPDLADAIEEAWLELRNTWMAEAPALPLDMFLLLGPEPSRVIDFRDLATPHALFGADPDADPDPDPEAAE